MPRNCRQAQFGQKWDDDWEEFFYCTWNRYSFRVEMPMKLEAFTLSKNDAAQLRDALQRFIKLN